MELYDQHFDRLNDILNDNIMSKLSDDLSKDENDICETCNTKSIVQDYNNGFTLCKNCGIIKDIIIDTGAEWRYYGTSDSKSSDPTRCGIPVNPLLPISSMGTCIGGNKYGPLQRLHSWNAMPSNERSLWYVFENINKKTQNSDLINKIKEECKFYYKKITEKEKNITGTLTRGRVREGIIAACCFIACKNNGVPRLASEIAEIFEISTTDVTRGLKKFVELERKKNININIHITNTDDFIRRYCYKLNIRDNDKKIASIIASRIKQLNILSENTPSSIAASILYLISTVYNLDISKEYICSKINISNVTITKSFKTLNKHKNILFLGLISKDPQ